MSEKEITPPVKKPKDEEIGEEGTGEEKEEISEVEELIDKMYKIVSDLGKAVESLATYVSAGKEAQRGLIEAVGKMGEKIDILTDRVEKLTIGLKEVFAEQKKGKYAEVGGESPEGTGVGEVATIGNVGAPVEKVDVKKVMTPKVPGVVNKVGKESEINDVIRDIIHGKVKLGEVPSRVWEVIRK